MRPTADDILSAVNDVIGEATASWSSDFFMLRAVNGAIVQVDGVEKGRTEVRDGFITGMITVTSERIKADVVIVALFWQHMKPFPMWQQTLRIRIATVLMAPHLLLLTLALRWSLFRMT